MRCEHIRAVPSWHKGPPRYDTVFIQSVINQDTITEGLTVGRVQQFFSFSFE